MYSNFLPKRGGVQKHIHDLCTSAMSEGNCSVVLTWGPSVPSFEIIDGIKVNRIRMPRLFSYTRYPLILFLFLHIMQLSKRCNIDVIHAHDYLPGLAAVLAGVFVKKPVVVTFHLPIQTTTFHPKFRVPPILVFERLLKKCFIKYVNKIICVSKFTYNETLRLGFSSSKLKLIYNWVMPPTMKDLSLNCILERFNLNRRYLLSVGRLLEQQKCFSKLIHAFKLLLAKGYDLDLVIVGDGPDKENYLKYSAKLGVENRIYVMTDVSDVDLERLYCGCELFVLPSCNEGLPLVLLEAMNYGKPIIATNVGGIPEVIKDGYNGILVNPNYIDLLLGLEKLLSLPLLKDCFGERSRELVAENFSKRNCERTLMFLEKTINCKQIRSNKTFSYSFFS